MISNDKFSYFCFLANEIATISQSKQRIIFISNMTLDETNSLYSIDCLISLHPGDHFDHMRQHW